MKKYKRDETNVEHTTRVVPDTDLEPGYPSFEKPDTDIRRLPDIRLFQ